MSGPTETVDGSTKEGRDPNQQRAVDVYNQAYQTRQELEKQVDDAKLGLAREDLRHFMEYTIRDSHKDTLIKCSQIHLSWCKHINKYLNSGYDIGILAPYGCGKTIRWDHLITMADGSRIPIGEVQVGDEVLSVNVDNHQLRPQVVTNVIGPYRNSKNNFI